MGGGGVQAAQWLRASNIFRQLCYQHLSGAGWSPAGSVGRDLYLQKKLNYQYLTTSVAVVLVVR